MFTWFLNNPAERVAADFTCQTLMFPISCSIIHKLLTTVKG